MSNLSRCDRCGETTPSEGTNMMVLVTPTVFTYAGGYPLESRDLCPDCRAAVLAVMREVPGKP